MSHGQEADALVALYFWRCLSRVTRQNRIGPVIILIRPQSDQISTALATHLSAQLTPSIHRRSGPCCGNASPRPLSEAGDGVNPSHRRVRRAHRGAGRVAWFTNAMRGAMYRFVLLIALALPLAAQTTVGSARPQCGSVDPAQPRFLMFLPATLVSGVTTSTISVPVCVRLGANLKLDMAAVGGPVLDAVGTAPAPAPDSP